MSVQAMSAVWHEHLDPAAKLLLLAMADHANEEGGNVFPSVRRLARKTGFVERHVRRLLARLRKQGFLVVTAQSCEYQPTTYRLALGALIPDADIMSAPPVHMSGTPCSGSQGGDDSQVSLTISSTVIQPSEGERPRRTRPSRARLGTQLPDDFGLTPERAQFAVEGGLTDASLIFGAFKDHYRATGRIFKDWDAAWRSWCRKERDIREARQQRGGR